ncbi:epidermal retinol dehydrogenase 2-like [Centruroides vittatus]|uniref:epidermal retinol dehydrogenase 2-like n=1 Tax=Centruroides vittatus TaxID=120091 RepID=UPI00350F4596
MNQVLKSLLIIPYIIYLCIEALVMKLIPRSLLYKNLEGEVVLITGGGSGIGRLLALRFSLLGCRIVIWDINDKGNLETSALVKNFGGECYSYVCDITNREKVYELAKTVKEQVGPVTILVNNAGIVTGNLLLDCPDDMIEKTFQINALSHFWMLKAFLPDMIAANYGHVVTISSMAGISGCAKLVDYSSSKFAAVGLHEGLCCELRKQNVDGIKLTLICPFFINTGMFTGINTGVIGLLEPDYVADEIVSAVRCNKDMLILPTSLSWLFLFKSLFPVSVGLTIHDLLKSQCIMDNFIGRDSKKR